MNRRTTIKIIGAGLMTPSIISPAMQSLEKRSIGTKQEKIACVGLGTWQTFDAGEDQHKRNELGEVLKKLVNSGASVIDSSPMYGSSEEVVGDLTTALGLNKQVFMATKVWTTGRDAGITQMNESLKLLKRASIDLMQVHNLVDWQVHLTTLREWKEKGKVRYIGLTHYTDSAHDTLANIIKNNPIDFIQINYSLNNRNAEKVLLPVARDHGVAVLINRPFDEGALFQRVKGKEVPAYAKEFDCTTWGSFFLKFILANKAVTCVIPGTSKVKHLVDNLSAGVGRFPEPAHLTRMIQEIS